jgi:hypothetical protein
MEYENFDLDPFVLNLWAEYDAFAAETARLMRLADELDEIDRRTRARIRARLQQLRGGDG